MTVESGIPKVTAETESALLNKITRASRIWVTEHARNAPAIDAKAVSIFRWLHEGHIWDALGNMDGRESENELERGVKREWTRANFKSTEIADIYYICQDWVEILTNKRNVRANELFYDFVTQAGPNSVFEPYINETDMKKLNNGRFWEALRYAGESTGKADKVLMQALEEGVDMDFTPQGIAIYKNHSGDRIHTQDWSSFSNSEILKLGDFIKNSTEGIALDDVALLVRPYINALVSLEEEVEGQRKPRFGGGHHNFSRLLSEHWLQVYLSASEVVRGSLGRVLSSLVNEDEEHVRKVMQLIPNAGDLVTRLEASKGNKLARAVYNLQ